MRRRERKYREGTALPMTQHITQPKIPPETAEFSTGAIGNEASQSYAKVKRLGEVFVVIAVAPPVLLTIALLALAILWSLGRPVLVLQERVGRGGRVFKQLKLRTRLVSSGSEHPPTTALGRFVENSHLAELPQLWNVAVGDLSIVDPSFGATDKVRL